MSNIISVTKNRLPNNTSYYRTKTSLLLNLSHHWHELTVNLDIFEEHSLWSTWPCTKSSNSVSNNNLLQLLHSVSADQQTELYSFSNRILQLLYLATARNQLFNSLQQLLLLPSLLFTYIYQPFQNIIGVSIYVTLHHLVLLFTWYYIIWWNVLNSSIESSSRNIAWPVSLEDSSNLNIYMCSP